MKILVFCTADLRFGTGTGVRARLICEGLRQVGSELCVVCSDVPSYFADLGIKSYSIQAGSEKMLEQAIVEFKPDIVYGISEGLADLVTRVARKYGCHLAFDVHAIGVFEIIELGRSYGPRGKRIANSIRCLFEMRKADVLTVASYSLIPIVRNLCPQVLPIVGITDISQFTPYGPCIRKMNNTGNLHVMYAGNFYKWQGIDLFLEMISLLLNKDIEFTLLGSAGRVTNNADSWGHLWNLDAVHLIDHVDYHVMPHYVRGADVLVVPRRFMLSTHFASPQKLGDFMALGRLIVATDLAPHRWALADPPSGILCKPSPRKMAQAILSATNPELRTLLPRNARKKAEDLFDHIKQTRKILDSFETIGSV